MADFVKPEITLQPGAEAVLTAVSRQQFSSPQAYNLQLAASRMLLIGGFDQLICLDDLFFEPFPYQIKAAQAALRRFPRIIASSAAARCARQNRTQAQAGV